MKTKTFAIVAVALLALAIPAQSVITDAFGGPSEEELLNTAADGDVEGTIGQLIALAGAAYGTSDMHERMIHQYAFMQNPVLDPGFDGHIQVQVPGQEPPIGWKATGGAVIEDGGAKVGNGGLVYQFLWSHSEALNPGGEDLGRQGGTAYRGFDSVSLDVTVPDGSSATGALVVVQFIDKPALEGRAYRFYWEASEGRFTGTIGGAGYLGWTDTGNSPPATPNGVPSGVDLQALSLNGITIGSRGGGEVVVDDVVIDGAKYVVGGKSQVTVDLDGESTLAGDVLDPAPRPDAAFNNLNNGNFHDGYSTVIVPYNAPSPDDVAPDATMDVWVGAVRYTPSGPEFVAQDEYYATPDAGEVAQQDSRAFYLSAGGTKYGSSNSAGATPNGAPGLLGGGDYGAAYAMAYSGVMQDAPEAFGWVFNVPVAQLIQPGVSASINIDRDAEYYGAAASDLGCEDGQGLAHCFNVWGFFNEEKLNAPWLTAGDQNDLVPTPFPGASAAAITAAGAALLAAGMVQDQPYISDLNDGWIHDIQPDFDGSDLPVLVKDGDHYTVGLSLFTTSAEGDKFVMDLSDGSSFPVVRLKVYQTDSLANAVTGFDAASVTEATDDPQALATALLNEAGNAAGASYVADYAPASFDGRKAVFEIPAELIDAASGDVGFVFGSYVEYDPATTYGPLPEERAYNQQGGADGNPASTGYYSGIKSELIAAGDASYADGTGWETLNLNAFSPDARYFAWRNFVDLFDYAASPVVAGDAADAILDPYAPTIDCSVDQGACGDDVELGDDFAYTITIRDEDLVGSAPATPSQSHVDAEFLLEDPNGQSVPFTVDDSEVADNGTGDYVVSHAPTTSLTGKYTLTASAEDGAGNQAMASWNILVEDTIPPAVTMSKPVGGSFVAGGADVDVKYTVTEVNSFDVRVTLETSCGTSTFTDRDQRGSTDVSQTVTCHAPDSDGDVDAVVDATDDASNVGSETVTITVDATGPEAPTSLTVTPLPGGAAKITWTDPVDAAKSPAMRASGLDHVEIGRSGGACAGTPTTIVPAAQANSHVDTPASDGTYCYYVRGVDAVGNVGAWAQAAVDVDSTPPTISNVAVAPAVAYHPDGAQVTITADVSDARLDQVELDATALGAGTVTMSDDDADGIYEAQITIDAASGRHDITVTATDEAGNTGTATRAIDVDADAPQATAASVAYPAMQSKAKQGDDVTLSVDVDDQGGSGIATVTATIDSTVVVLSDADSDGTYTATYTVPDTLQDGIYTVRFDAADGAGNDATSVTTQLNVNSDQPSVTGVTIDYPRAEDVASTGDELHVTATISSPGDDIFGPTVQWDATGSDALTGGPVSGSAGTWQAEATITLDNAAPDGFTVTATSGSGVEGTPFSFAPVVDRTAPTVAWDSATVYSRSGTTAAAFTCTEANPASYTVQGTTGALATCSGSHTAVIDTAGLAEGRHDLPSITVTDVVGLEGSSGACMDCLVIDDTAPETVTGATARPVDDASGDVLITWDSVDDLGAEPSGVAAYRVHVGGDCNAQMLDTVSHTDGTMSLTHAGIGMACDYAIVAIDAAGNEAAPGATTFQGTPPLISDEQLTYSQGTAAKAGTDVTIDATVTDANGLQDVVFHASAASGDDIALTGSGDAYSATFTVSDEDEGVHVIDLVATDAFGTTSTKTLELVIDHTPPATHVARAPGQSELTNDADVQVLIQAEPDTSGIVQVDLYMDDGDGWVLEASDVPTGAPVDVTLPADGTYGFAAIATDGAGHQELLPVDAETAITLDTVAPTTTASLDPASPDGLAGWYVTAPQLTFAVSDEHDTATYYEVDAGSAIEWDGAPVTFSDSADERIVTYWSLDAASNEETASTVTIAPVDTVAPVPVDDAPENTQTQEVDVTLSMQDDTSGPGAISYRTWQEGEAEPAMYTDYTGPINVGAGVTYIRYIVQDEAGNDAPSVVTDVAVDLEDPVIGDMDDLEGTTGDGLTFTVGVTDDFEVDSVEARIDLSSAQPPVLPVDHVPRFIDSNGDGDPTGDTILLAQDDTVQIHDVVLGTGEFVRPTSSIFGDQLTLLPGAPAAIDDGDGTFGPGDLLYWDVDEDGELSSADVAITGGAQGTHPTTGLGTPLIDADLTLKAIHVDGGSYLRAQDVIIVDMGSILGAHVVGGPGAGGPYDPEPIRYQSLDEGDAGYEGFLILPDFAGTFPVDIVARDTAGRESVKSVLLHIEDDDDPIVSAFTVDDGDEDDWVEGPATVTVTAYDNVGITTVEMLADGSVVQTVQLDAAHIAGTFQFQAAFDDSGEAAYTVRVADAAGNDDTTSQQTFTVDADGPTIAHDAAAAWQASDAITVHLDFDDDVSGVETKEAKTWCDTEPEDYTALSSDQLTIEGQGTCQARIRATDNAGRDTILGFTVRLDDAAPEAQYVDAPTTASEGESVEVVVEADDALSGILSVDLVTDTRVISMSVRDGQYVGTLDADDDGVIQYHVRLRDVAGNQRDLDQKTLVVSDLDGPAAQASLEASQSLQIDTDAEGNVTFTFDLGASAGAQLWASNSPWRHIANIPAGSTTWELTDVEDGTKFILTSFVMENGRAFGRMSTTGPDQDRLDGIEAAGHYVVAVSPVATRVDSVPANGTGIFVVYDQPILSGKDDGLPNKVYITNPQQGDEDYAVRVDFIEDGEVVRSEYRNATIPAHSGEEIDIGDVDGEGDGYEIWLESVHSERLLAEGDFPTDPSRASILWLIAGIVLLLAVLGLMTAGVVGYTRKGAQA